MTPRRAALALAATGCFAWALAAGSAAEVAWHGPGASELRLSWNARPERIESCRRLSDAELAARPAHMRQRVECEGRSATYDLRVTIDGRLVDSAVIVGGGLRQDRPILLLRDYRVAPGAREVRVAFVRREAETAGEGAERAERRVAALPPRLEFAEVVRFRPGAAALLTVEREAFVLRTALASGDAEPDR